MSEKPGNELFERMVDRILNYRPKKNRKKLGDAAKSKAPGKKKKETTWP